ncbi:Uu.00g021510.m01.CDS01 [Anthostomella pinea]|uniref:Uu.00g021510.m01.CDS01 n=1 Tax=Anthostomella pinea TaxID=933095 RepID=A0AAI8VZQ7_9PEZI|nr:Uu.00g021510.m01.CDS01 [Anthostomella pinea]
MAFFSRLRTQFLSWSQETPLPTILVDATPVFQSWREFDSSNNAWKSVNTTSTRQTESHQVPPKSELHIVTWNVDATPPLPESRMSAVVSHIDSLTPAVGIVFLQEVSRAALDFLLNDTRIREAWFVSDSDKTNWEGQSFASMTLLSKSRFGCNNSDKFQLGGVWRVKYLSRFGRDALCCDVFVPLPESASGASQARVRLINVHLDSLPIQPTRRPRQIAIVASLLRSAGHGVVAGDFNPVLPGDDSLIRDNDLVDVWAELRGNEPGFTWGIDGNEPFPPNRMDKVAMLGLRALEIEVMHPEMVKPPQDVGEGVPWSDHSGLRCSFALVGH